MQQPDDSLCFEYVPCEGGARLVALYGDTPCPVLPETLGGLPLAELGPYCFAQAPRTDMRPPESEILRTGGAAPPPAGAYEKHRIGGSFLTALTLPDSLRVLGSCAFYNCRALSSLSFGAAPLTLGSDVFLNTFALHALTLRAAPDAPSPLCGLLGCLAGEIRARFAPAGKVLAEAVYPEYWEDIEETPAHILLHAYSGQGYHYRQCFADGVPRWEEYDAVFPLARAEEPAAAAAALALGRLRWPYALAPQAAEAYRAFLGAHAAPLLTRLQQAQDTDALRALLALDALDAGALRAGVAAAAAAENTAFASLLTDALHCLQADIPAQSCRYRFDF